MNKSRDEFDTTVDAFANNARVLISATADVAGDEVAKARKRLAAALEAGKATYGRVREKAMAGAKVTDVALREHPYQAIAIGFGVGLLVGYLASHRSSHQNEE